MIYIGIDPGKTGGLSFIEEFGQKAISFAMPATEVGIPTMIRSIALSSDIKIEDIPSSFRAIIEQVHSMPSQGVTSVFTFGQNYGLLRGVLVAMGIPFEEVAPSKWQNYFGLKKPELGSYTTDKEKQSAISKQKSAHKKNILNVAQNMYPNSSVALQSADSLMLAEYLRRNYRRE